MSSFVRFRDWMRHYHLPIAILSALIWYAQIVFAAANTPQWSLSLSLTVIVYTWTISEHHSRRACSRCLCSQAVESPQLAWVYGVHHLLRDRTGIILYTCGVLMAGVLCLLDMWPRVMSVAITVFLLSDMASESWHHRYRQWCPQCRDDETVDEPLPVDRAGR